jgi:hypothetical protein
MEIPNACRDAPKETDYIRDDVYFGTTATIIRPIVDHRKVWTVYNQFINDDTLMACGSYGVIHADNINELLGGGKEVNPRGHWLEFVRVHKTNKYNPLVKWSSLQDQMDFAVATGVIGGYYRVYTQKEIQEGISKSFLWYTGSTNIDREATKNSPDNVCVIKKWSPAHIVCFIGYDSDHVYIRNSGALKHMKLKREDLDQLFSIYIIVPKIDANIFERAKARQEARRGLYDRYTLIWPLKRVMKNVPIDAPKKVENGKTFVFVDEQRYEVIRKL